MTGSSSGSAAAPTAASWPIPQSLSMTSPWVPGAPVPRWLTLALLLPAMPWSATCSMSAATTLAATLSTSMMSAPTPGPSWPIYRPASSRPCSSLTAATSTWLAATTAPLWLAPTPSATTSLPTPGSRLSTWRTPRWAAAAATWVATSTPLAAASTSTRRRPLLRTSSRCPSAQRPQPTN